MAEEKSLTVIDEPIVRELIATLDEDVANAITLTELEVKRLVKYATKIRYGDELALPMLCTNSACIASAQCPLVKMGKSPVGHQCPFERYAMTNWRADYARSLNVNEEDKVERGLLMDLVEADILNFRANMVLADEGFIMDNPIGIDQTTGLPVMRHEEHIALSLKKRAQDRKDKVLKMFVATRDSKIKSIASLQHDPSKYMAELRAKAKAAKELQDKHVLETPKIINEVMNNDSR